MYRQQIRTCINRMSICTDVLRNSYMLRIFRLDVAH
jgi:hypothetical protein